MILISYIIVYTLLLLPFPLLFSVPLVSIAENSPPSSPLFAAMYAIVLGIVWGVTLGICHIQFEKMFERGDKLRKIQNTLERRDFTVKSIKYIQDTIECVVDAAYSDQDYDVWDFTLVEARCQDSIETLYYKEKKS